MSAVLYPPSRPQSIGEVLDSAFRIFRVTLIRCLPYGVLAMVAGQLQNIYDIVLRHPLHQVGGGDRLWWVFYVLGAVLAFAFVNVILLRQATMASGSRSETRTALLEGLRRAPAMTALFILLGIVNAACFAPLFAIPHAYMAWGITALSIPAIYVDVLLSCSWAALLVGRKGIGASIVHSVRLVRGNWWRTVMIYAVGFAMLAVLFVSSGVIAAVLIPFAAGGDIAVTTAVSAVLVAVLGAVYVPFFTSVMLALYGDLEVRAEAVHVERQIAGAAVG